MFTMEFDTTGAPFKDSFIFAEAECRRIFHGIVDRMEDGAREGAILDADGTIIGAWSWKEDAEVGA